MCKSLSKEINLVVYMGDLKSGNVQAGAYNLCVTFMVQYYKPGVFSLVTLSKKSCEFGLCNIIFKLNETHQIRNVYETWRPNV